MQCSRSPRIHTAGEAAYRQQHMASAAVISKVISHTERRRGIAFERWLQKRVLSSSAPFTYALQVAGVHQATPTAVCACLSAIHSVTPVSSSAQLLTGRCSAYCRPGSTPHQTLLGVVTLRLRARHTRRILQQQPWPAHERPLLHTTENINTFFMSCGAVACNLAHLEHQGGSKESVCVSAAAVEHLLGLRVAAAAGF